MKALFVLMLLADGSEDCVTITNKFLWVMRPAGGIRSRSYIREFMICTISV